MKIPTLHVSLTPGGMRPLRWAQWGIILVIGLLGIWGLGIWQNHQSLAQQLDEYQAAITIARNSNHAFIQQAREAGIDLGPNRRASIAQEVTFTNQLQAHQAFSWTQFLTDLEAAVPSGISMASVRPDFSTRGIMLGGSARTLNDIQTLVNQLERHPSFTNVVLSNHAKKTKGKKNPQPFVVFQLLVTYQPESGDRDEQSG